MNVFDEDLEHRIIPQSLGRPVLNKRQYGEYFRGLMPRYKWLRVCALSITEYTFLVNGIPPLIVHPA
ncbi:hypothetical protein BDQ17DRAFT_1344483 [Cyathus striatus]|nr:hypothetical protein BDQ17DRAFT_1344483 [Cyathus striatus]